MHRNDDTTTRFSPTGPGLARPACQFTGHRDLVAAASIAARHGGGITQLIPAGVTHRRAGRTCPGSPPRDVTHAAAAITAQASALDVLTTQIPPLARPPGS